MIQPASGGYRQFSDVDMSVYEEFYRDYPNFIGFNYAEQFWGFDNNALSPTWTQRIAHFVDLMKLNQKYGGYLVVSWCGTQYSPSINPIAMMKLNPAFAAICKQSPENFILCEKYTTTSYKSDMESICLGTYLSGYSGQYGIRYDNSGWSDATGTNQNFTLATAGAPMLEHTMLTGETVIDGPEIIWLQDIQGLNNGTTADGYTTRQWGLFSQYSNVVLDIFRKILDGTVRIPTRQEVINRTKVAIIQDVTSGSADNIYSSPQTLFEGLYRMDVDGDYQNNLYFTKKTGRYPTIPTVYQLADTNARSFQLQVSNSLYSTRWPNLAAKTNELNMIFPQEYTGDIYAGRNENAWVIYNPYKTDVTKTNQTASGSIPFKYNTCDHVDLTLSQYTSGVMKEFSNSVTFYLGNYDNQINLGSRTDTFIIYGSSSLPTYSWADRASHSASTVTSGWTNGVWTLTVLHNGALDITVNCAGTAAGRLTNYTTAAITPPAQPATYVGTHQYEAECFDYKSVAGYTGNGYGTGISNYTGQGYLNFGTISSASIRDNITVLKSGTYRLDAKYAVIGANISTIDLYVNGAKVATPAFTQTPTLGNWAINEQYINLNAGANTIEFRASGTGASPVYFDNIVVIPTVITSGIVIQENRAGFASVDGTVDNTYSGYTGNGYANPSHSYGAGIDWSINFDSSVTKSLTFRYASTNNSTADLLVNGTNVVANIQFPSTGALTNWEYVTVYPYIAAGTVDVRLQSSTNTGLPFIDYVEVTGGWGGTPPPTGLTAVGAANQINLSWIASSNAVSYNVKRSLTSGGDYTAVAGGVATTNFNDTGLAGGTTYYYVVSAVSSALGEGDDSAEVSATTLTPTLLPLADSYVESSNPGVNYGTSTNMLVKNNITLATRNAYLMFDVHALANVSSATLTLVPNRVDDATVKMYYGLAPTNWNEAGIIWNNQPGSSGVIFATNTVSVGVADVVDVTSVVKSQATNGGLLSIEITQPTNNLNGLIQFCSKEHPTNSWRPILQYVIPENTAPYLAAITSRTNGVGVTLNITNSATDSDVPAQTLTFSLLSAPTNAVINSVSGVLTWRPLVTQANTTNSFTVMVADNGTPSMGATQSFVVAVTNLPKPVISSPFLAAGQLVLQVNGASGPDYQIQSSTNLFNWSAVLTTNSPAMPFVWTNSTTGAPNNFFRIQAGPPF